MTRQKISVLIHTLNEVDQIADCLRTIEWADEVYLLDSFSDDGTVELIEREFPFVVVERRRSLGSAAQKNYGMTKVAHDWVLVVDADERVTPVLRDEILATLEAPQLWAYRVQRRNFILGKRIRFSGLQRDTVVRLFHRDHARYPNRRVHADLLVDGEIGRLKHLLDHNYVRSFEHLANKTIRYATWGGAQLYRDGARPTLRDLTFRPIWRFFRDWILNLGILDGYRGLVVCALHAQYTFLKYAKLWEHHERERRGEPVNLPEFEESSEIWVLPWKQDEDGE